MQYTYIYIHVTPRRTRRLNSELRRFCGKRLSPVHHHPVRHHHHLLLLPLALAPMSQNFAIVDDPLSLARIRSILIRLEDTIIFSLIERAQFVHNPRIYQPGAFAELTAAGFAGSWLEWFLKEIETFHGASRPCFRAVRVSKLPPQPRRADIPGESPLVPPRQTLRACVLTRHTQPR
jgi:hypothetical protein